jgi:hypothetical protein
MLFKSSLSLYWNFADYEYFNNDPLAKNIQNFFPIFLWQKPFLSNIFKKISKFFNLQLTMNIKLQKFVKENFFYIMYFGLQDTKPPPCPLHLTKQGGSIHCSQLYLYSVYKLVLYILETITMYCIIQARKQITNKYTEIVVKENLPLR